MEEGSRTSPNWQSRQDCLKCYLDSTGQAAGPWILAAMSRVCKCTGAASLLLPAMTLSLPRHRKETTWGGKALRGTHPWVAVISADSLPGSPGVHRC